MQLVLNDYSIDNQFDNYKSFENYYKDTLCHVLEVINEKDMTLHKLAVVLSKPLINGKPLNEVFQKANQASLTHMKIMIKKLLAAPFMDDEIITKDGIEYECPFSTDIPNCFTEAIERNCPVLSFQHLDFVSREIACKRNKENRVLSNILNIQDILWNLLCYEPTEIRYILEKYPFDKKIELAEIHNKCYAEEALRLLETKDLCNVTYHINDLIRDKSTGTKTRFWDAISENKKTYFEYRISISSGREFRLFFLWKDRLIFLNGFIKKHKRRQKGKKKKL